MTRWSVLISLFPAVHLAAVLASVALAVVAPSPLSFATVPMALYGLPVAAFRLHQRVAPIRPGHSKLVGGGYNAWWGAYQIQWWFLTTSLLEAPLRAIPGAFSAWLRLWGSKVGQGVMWTPQLTILDRSLLRIGDHVLVGHGCVMTGHLVARSDDNLGLLVQPITIGSGVVLGGHVNLGPGVRIGSGVEIGYGAKLAPCCRVGDAATVGPMAVIDLGARVPKGGDVPAGSALTRRAIRAGEVAA